MTAHLDRRDFLVGSGALAAALALGACSSSGSDAGPTTAPRSSTTSTPSTATTPPAAPGVDAFLAGYPLVTTVRTMQMFAGLLGVNTVFGTPGLVDPTAHRIVAPNRDTAYVLAVLDLANGPLTLTLPAIPDRYHVFQFIDAWMGGFGLLGTRTTHGRGGTYVIARSGTQATVPAGAQRLDCPTGQAIMLGRIRAVDEADGKRAAAVGRGVTLVAPGPKLTMAKPLGTPQAVASNGMTYYDELCAALVPNPPVTPVQRAAIASGKELGIVAGATPSSTASAAQRATLLAAIRTGVTEASDRSAAGSHRVNGWDVNLQLGKTAGADVLRRQAVIARSFWGPVPPSEAVYPHAALASDGKPLDGTKRYRITFAKGQAPPVDAFWSFTAYGPDNFLVPNPEGKYTVSGDTPGLVTQPDGSIVVLLQHDAPATDRPNWLPVPAGPFGLSLRLYLPRQPIIDGSWVPPVVEVVG